LNTTIADKITSQIQQAHSAGIMTRYWDTPLYPIYARDNVFKAVLELGSDLLNGDDLAAAASF